MLEVVRNALRLIGPQRRMRFALVGVLSALVSGLEAVSALLVFVLMRFVLEPEKGLDLPLFGDPGTLFPEASDQQLVLGLIAVFLVFFVFRGIAFVGKQYLLVRVSENTGLELSKRLVDGYLHMPYELHLRRNSSELIRNVYDNVLLLINSVFTPIANLVSEAILVIVMIAVMVAISPIGTGVAALVMSVVTAFTLRIIQPRIRDLGVARQTTTQSALQHFQQGLGGLRDIKVLGREEAFKNNFADVRQIMAAVEYKRSAWNALPRVVLEVTFMSLLLGALYWAVATENTEEVLSSLGVFAYAGLRLQPALQSISWSLTNLQFAGAAVDDVSADISTFIDEQGSTESTTPVPLITLSESVVFDSVTYRYEGSAAAAIDNLSFEIRHGESIGVAGRTGCGKSTLMDVLCGLLQPTQGRLLVDGHDIAGAIPQWQHNIGVVHQSSFLLDDTLGRNIALGLDDDEIDRDALEYAVEVAQLRELVEQLPEGLRTSVGERGVRLSGGQRQRVAIARAIYRRPSLLILDEGTSALDTTTESAVIRAVGEIAGDCTLIMVAHRLATITRCDRVLFLDDGRIEGFDTFAELRRTVPSFHEMTSA